ncbi:flippase-like domain-containing protein [Leptobacterium flavescens]|uniref:Flippase-like domain-containing protein n=1 Tax=Leptobacterium flavescens TaxID=472055 RepID=A0A6P0UVP2_9FLAO|nr:lysylphosphatidylglycerol synthase transmembrane domain-containing protein [Leptobacterium flavescens]NER14486.1 flippase-like domain-containing protein [Leptobacterium flavescens]
MEKKKFIKLLKIILPLALGVFLVWYSYTSTSEEDRQKIYRYIREADYFWVAISLFMGLLSHISRAYRWSFLLEPMGYKVKFLNNLMAVSIAYFANLGIPRSGEVLRATTLSSYEEVPFQKAFGTIVAERVIDFIMLFLLIGIALSLQTDTILDFLMEKGFNFKSLLILAGAGLVGLFIFVKFIRKSSHPIALKLKTFVNGLLEGVVSIFKMKKRWAFLFHTFFIWGMYVFMFWIIKFSVPEVSELNFGIMLVAFIAGAFAMSASNGGIGWYPIAIATIFSAYGISKASGDAFGWIMWISQTLLVVFLGVLSFLFIPIYNRNK